ncbi:hypothetical protein [Leifsonia sp. RAF41]|uniref:hypothetical protein n=1 Tax=Leifsonia sp. RAF41 TaxID=3233056 RepID=UPI003F96313F
MIVDVALSPGSLDDISERVAGEYSRGVQRLLIERLRSHGALVWASRRELTATLDLIRAGDGLTEGEKKEWSDLLIWLKQGGRVRLSVDSDDCALESLTRWSPSVESSFAGRPIVAILSQRIFGRLFPDAQEGLVATSSDFEVATGAMAPFASPFARLQALADLEAYPPGTQREDIWQQLLAPLAARSKQVTIFDRYAFAELFRRRQSGSSEPEHLEWLLKKLDSHAPRGTVVKVFGSVGYGHGGSAVPQPPGQIAAALLQRMPTRLTRLAGVELHTLTGIHAHPHDRHISFGSTFGLELPSGLDRLAKTQISHTFSFGYKWREGQLQALRDREIAVALARPRVTSVYA